MQKALYVLFIISIKSDSYNPVTSVLFDWIIMTFAAIYFLSYLSLHFGLYELFTNYYLFISCVVWRHCSSSFISKITIKYSPLTCLWRRFFFQTLFFITNSFLFMPSIISIIIITKYSFRCVAVVAVFFSSYFLFYFNKINFIQIIM